MWQFTNANAIDIPDGADMKSDTYKAIGVYVCNTDVSTKTLLNCPVEEAFTLFVYKSASGSQERITQEFRVYHGGLVVKRYFNGMYNLWGETYEHKDTGFLKFKRFTQQITPQSDILAYAETVLAEYSFDLTYLSIEQVTGITGFSGYSGGLLLHTNDTVTIAFYSYNDGAVYINGRSRTSEWKGWKKIAGVAI